MDEKPDVALLRAKCESLVDHDLLESETSSEEWVEEAGPSLRERLEKEALRIMDEADAALVTAQARAAKLLAAAEALDDHA